MTVYTVIVAYNSSAFLDACLRTLEKEWTEIVVVDNSTDPRERAECMAIAASRRVKYELQERNIGFGAGVNRGVEIVSPVDGDWVWALNPDTEVSPGCVTALLRAAAANGAVLLSPVVTMGVDRDRVWFAGGDLNLRTGRTVHRSYGLLLSDLQLFDTTCTFLTGAALFVSSEFWRKLGGMREDLFLYWEDADFSRKAIEAGARLEVVPDALVWHQVGASGGLIGMSAGYHYFMQRNRCILAIELHRCVLTAFVATFPEILRSLAISVLREESDRGRKLGASIRGILDGLRTGRKYLALSRHG